VALHGQDKDLPVPEAPQTIRQNWIPFLTFFFRRIIFCAVNIVSSAVGTARGVPVIDESGSGRSAGVGGQKSRDDDGRYHTALGRQGKADVRPEKT